MKSFLEIYKIFEDSFPKNERRDYQRQKDLLTNKFYQLKTYEQYGDILAFMGVWTFDNFTFLEHFATTPKSRGKGIGSKMFSELLESSNLLILEVEPPNGEVEKRRIDFYARNGMFLNDFDYLQPPLNTGDGFLPLKIMSSNREISKAEFDSIKNTLYKHVYNTRS